jgi:hypothetical protein
MSSSLMSYIVTFHYKRKSCWTYVGHTTKENWYHNTLSARRLSVTKLWESMFWWAHIQPVARAYIAGLKNNTTSRTRYVTCFGDVVVGRSIWKQLPFDCNKQLGNYHIQCKQCTIIMTIYCNESLQQVQSQTVSLTLLVC